MLLATLYVALAARAGANVASRRGRVAFLARSVRTLPRGGEVRRFVTAARNPPPVSANRDPMRRMSDGPPGDGADTAPSYSARERDTWAATPQIFVTAAERELFEMLQAVVVDAGNTTTLRVAGGWVRDKLLGNECYDIDIALDDQLGAPFAEQARDTYTILCSGGGGGRGAALFRLASQLSLSLRPLCLSGDRVAHSPARHATAAAATRRPRRASRQSACGRRRRGR